MAETPHDPLETADSSAELPPTTPIPGSARWPWLAGGLAVLIVAALVIALLAVHRGALATIGAHGSSITTASAPASVDHGGGQSACPAAAQHPNISQAIELNDLSMVSATEGWAVGAVTHFGGDATAGVILHYTNGQWQQVAGNYAHMAFDSIAMTSPTDGWIGGVDTSSASLGDSEAHAVRLLYHYDGHSWQAVPLQSDLFADTDSGSAGETIVRMFSATDGWLMMRDATIIGNYSVLHYDGASWQRVSTPFASSQDIFSTFYDIAVTGSDDVWLAGAHTDDSGHGGQNAILAHYHDGQWSTVANPPTGVVDTIAMTAPTSGWAVGYNRLLRFDGQHATFVALPAGLLRPGENIAAVNTAPDGTLWLTGASGADSMDPAQMSAFLLHRQSDGTWERITFPYHEQLGRLDILAPDNIWTIGAIVHFQGCAPANVTFIDQGALLHWHAGQWSQVIEPAS